jgi:hypothetical protein
VNLAAVLDRRIHIRRGLAWEEAPAAERFAAVPGVAGLAGVEEARNPPVYIAVVRVAAAFRTVVGRTIGLAAAMQPVDVRTDYGRTVFASAGAI